MQYFLCHFDCGALGSLIIRQTVTDVFVKRTILELHANDCTYPDTELALCLINLRSYVRDLVIAIDMVNASTKSMVSSVTVEAQLL